MMRMKHQDHPFQQGKPDEASKYRQRSLQTLECPGYGSVIVFQQSLMIKTCTGSQEIPQL